MTTQHVLEEVRAVGDPRHNEWAQRLARFGIATKGIVYVIMGVLAVMTAMNRGDGRITDSEGAVRTIGAQPFGQALLGATAVGLVGYVLWRFAQAVLDADNAGDDADGLLKRVGYAASGLTYAALAVGAVQSIAGSRDAGGDAARNWLDSLLASGDVGRVLVGLLGVVLVGVGGSQLWKAAKADFMRDVDVYAMSPTVRTWTRRLGRLGHAARGVVFPMLGWFLLRAATRADSSEWRGTDGALRELAARPHGTLLLAVVAAGLAAYGVYQVVLSRYRRIGSRRAY